MPLGETIVEYLEFNGWTQRDLARRTGLTPKTVSEICNGKAPITPSTALALEKVHPTLVASEKAVRLPTVSTVLPLC